MTWMSIRLLLPLPIGLLLSGCGHHSSFPDGYRELASISYAKLAGAAYCPVEILKNWTCGDFCSAFPDVKGAKICNSYAHNSVAFAVQVPASEGLEAQCVLSFRGSSNLQNWLDNLATWRADVDWDGCKGCKTHNGFLSIWLDMRSCVENALEAAGCPAGSNISVTGHSLGAALSSLAALELDAKGWYVVESYDFGRPRVGNDALADFYDSRFKGRSFRVTHARDPVPHLPPRLLGFEHTDPEIFYKTNLTKGWQQCNNSEGLGKHAGKANTSECSLEYDNLPLTLLHVDDHLQYMDMGICGCPGSSAFSESVPPASQLVV